CLVDIRWTLAQKSPVTQQDYCLAMLMRLQSCLCPKMPPVRTTDVLHCMVCTAALTRRTPQVLPCQHGFCRECLHSSQDCSTEVSCPTCGKPSLVPRKGFPEVFPRESNCTRFLQRVTLDDTYSRGATGQPHSNLHCRKHNMNAITSVCLSCFLPLCEKCHQRHRGNGHDDNCDRRQLTENYTSHKIQQLETLVTEYGESLRKSKADIDRCIVGKRMRLMQLDAMWSIRSQRLEQAKQDLQRHVNQLIERLQSMERELRQQLEQHHREAELVQKKTRVATVHSLQCLENMDSFVCELTENSAPSGCHTLNLLLNHDSVKSRVDKLLGDADDDVVDRLRQIHVVETLDSFNIARLKPHTMPVVSIEPPENPRVPANVNTSRMRLVETCQLVKTLPTGQGSQNIPEGLTFLPDGRLVVAWQQVHIYTQEGALENMLGSPSMKARGVSIVGVKGDIIATDHLRGQLVKFCDPANIQYYELQGVQAAGALHALAPDQFLLVDLLRHSVCKLSLPVQSHVVQIEWCTKDHLKEPCAIAVNKQGDIFVSDTAQNCIKVFNANGCYLRQFGSYDKMHCGQLKQPLGVCVDYYGNVLVADSGNRRVCMFDHDGLYIKDLVTKEQAGWPTMLALSAQGLLAVSDKSYGIIRLFNVYECLGSNC
ncbi:hypothetical protein LSAT2_001554, partial [Lamellibrachia satsuma]